MSSSAAKSAASPRWIQVGDANPNSGRSAHVANTSRVSETTATLPMSIPIIDVAVASSANDVVASTCNSAAAATLHTRERRAAAGSRAAPSATTSATLASGPMSVFAYSTPGCNLPRFLSCVAMARSAAVGVRRT